MTFNCSSGNGEVVIITFIEMKEGKIVQVRE
jgi:hypothetical protein